MPRVSILLVVLLFSVAAIAEEQSAPAPVLVPPKYGEVKFVEGRHVETDAPIAYWLHSGTCEASKEVYTFWGASLWLRDGSVDDYVDFDLGLDHPSATSYLNTVGQEQMTWTIDGEEFTTAVTDEELEEVRGKKKIEVIYGTKIPLDKFRALAFSTQAKVQLGKFELKWYEKDREQLRQFMSHWPRGMAGKFTIETDPEIEAAMAEQAAEEAAQKAEQRAATALRGIERHILPKQPERAQQLLQDLIERYPGTPSAKRAAELLQAR